MIDEAEIVTNDDVGTRLKAALDFRRVSQAALASKIDMSPALISRIAKNHQNVARDTCEKISVALNISYKWLKYGAGDMLDPTGMVEPTSLELSMIEDARASSTADKMVVIADFKDRQPYLAIRASSFSGKKISKPFVMRAENDCEALSIRSFDLILIDEVDRFSGDGAYLLCLGQPHFISIVTLNIDGTLTLSSGSNKKDVRLNENCNIDDQNIKIVAKVVSKLINFV